jgi:hypothetical protein
VRRTELKIPSQGPPSSKPKTCLAFKYQQHKCDVKRISETVELGLRVLVPIAEELRRNDHDVSDPFTGKKSFGITAMACRVGNDELNVSLWPPSDGDEWQIRTTWVRKLKSSRETERSEQSASPILEILEFVIARLEGTRDLRWLSPQEAREIELRSLSKPNRAGSDSKD